jgi:hypothetical protein
MTITDGDVVFTENAIWVGQVILNTYLLNKFA